MAQRAAASSPPAAGIIALRPGQPFLRLQLGAWMAAIVLVIASLHNLYVNSRLVPPALRPPLWRRQALVANAAFCATSSYGGRTA